MLAVVNPLQDLLGCSLSSFLQHGGRAGTQQDHDKTFEGSAYPRNAHSVGESDKTILPRVAVVHLIERLANPSCFAQLSQEDHWQCCGQYMPLGGGSRGAGRVLSGSGSSHCSTKTRGAGGVRAQNWGLWAGGNVVLRLQSWRQGEALWRPLWISWHLWADLHCWLPLYWDAQRKPLLEHCRQKTEE